MLLKKKVNILFELIKKIQKVLLFIHYYYILSLSRASLVKNLR
jgi:hypothetical protein